VPVQGRIIHPLDGGVAFQPYGVKPNEVNYSVSRTQLNAMLIEEAERRGARFFFQHELLSLNLKEMTSVYKCSSGTLNMHANFYLGCDGVASPVRAAILTNLRSDGVSGVFDEMQHLGVSYKELVFPCLETPEGVRDYSIDPRGLHIWPRGAHFLMALADKQQTFTGTLYLPNKLAKLDIPDSCTAGVPTFEELANDPAKYEEYFNRMYPDVPSIVKDYKEQLTSRSDSFLASVRTSHWHYEGKAVILGDAAHGVVPFFGQGMNLGFESVVLLSCFLKKHGGLSEDATRMEAICREYTAHHHSAANAMADMAIENFAEMSYKVSLQEFLHRKKIENVIEARHPMLFRSRYYMVTKTLIPYDWVKACGTYVNRCIDEVVSLCHGKEGHEEDIVAANDVRVVAAIHQYVTPFFKQHNIDISNPLKMYYPAAPGAAGSKL
jgi:kynurenine 3-monooxygenase